MEERMARAVFGSGNGVVETSEQQLFFSVE
jgi:hypothetical protein